jgi:hypothetical protein
MTLLFALFNFTNKGDVVWQLNATDMPLFSECAIACHRNPFVVFNEAQEDSALTRLQAADAFTYAKPVDVAKRRYLMLTKGSFSEQLYEESSTPKYPPVPVWESYSDPERVLTILALVSSTQNSTKYQEVGSFLGEYATSTWFLDSHTPIISKPVEDDDAEDKLPPEFEIKESGLRDIQGIGAGRGAFATGNHVRQDDIFPTMQGRWIPKFFPPADEDEDGVKKPYQWNVDESFQVYFVSSSIDGGDQFYNVAIDPEGFSKDGTQAKANVMIRRKNSDKGSLNLQAQCVVQVKEGDELLLSYNTAANKPVEKSSSSSSGGKNEVTSTSKKRKRSKNR